MCFAIGAHVAGSTDGLSSLDPRPPARGDWGMVDEGLIYEALVACEEDCL